jgi:hypothetical protein
MIAKMASPGQRTLTIAAEKAPPGAMAVVVIRSWKTGAEVKYTVAESRLPMLGEWNRTLDAAGRYERAMQASGLCEVTN